MHCFTVRESFYSWSRWTVSTSSRYLLFPLLKTQGFRWRISHIFTRDANIVKLLWKIREQGLLSITRTVTEFHCLLRLKLIQVSSRCPYIPGTEFAKKLWGGQSLLFAFQWRHHVHSTVAWPFCKIGKMGGTLWNWYNLVTMPSLATPVVVV